MEMKYFTAAVAMVGLICAAGLDSDQWVIPLAIMCGCAVWCVIYSLFIWRNDT